MNEINEQLKGISELVTRIDAKVLEITTKLDELIKALHEYDDDQIQHCEYSGLPSVKMYSNEGYGELPFEAFKLTNDYISSFNVDGAERRMDIIGQNGNTGEHYDYDGGFNNNKPANTNVDKKKRDKWVSPYPPNPKRSVNKEPITQKQYNLNRDKMANDHYELGGEGQNNITTQLYDNTNITTNITNHNNNKKQKRINK